MGAGHLALTYSQHIAVLSDQLSSHTCNCSVSIVNISNFPTYLSSQTLLCQLPGLPSHTCTVYLALKF